MSHADSASIGSDSETSTSSKWDPADILGLKDDVGTCRGTTTKVQRCSLRASGSHTVPQLIARLRDLTPAAASKRDDLLSQLALATLCSRYHSGQRYDIIGRWKAALEAEDKRQKAYARRLEAAQRENDAEMKRITAELSNLQVRQRKLTVDLQNTRQEAKISREQAAEAERLRLEADARVTQAELTSQQAVTDWERRVCEAEQLRQKAEARAKQLEEENHRRDEVIDTERAALAEDRARMDDRRRSLDGKFATIEDRRGRLDDEWSQLAAHRDKFEEQRRNYHDALLTPRPTPEKERFRFRDLVRKGFRKGEVPGSESIVFDPPSSKEDVPLPSIEPNTPPRTPERSILTETLPDVPRGSPVPARAPPRRKQVIAE